VSKNWPWSSVCSPNALGPLLLLRTGTDMIHFEGIARGHWIIEARVISVAFSNGGVDSRAMQACFLMLHFLPDATTIDLWFICMESY